MKARKHRKVMDVSVTLVTITRPAKELGKRVIIRLADVKVKRA